MLATRIAANAPLGLAVTKRLMMEELGAGPWPEIARTCLALMQSEDALEGAAAFAEKRTPVWQGR